METTRRPHVRKDARRSPAATAKARAHTTGQLLHSFRGLLDHQGTLTGNTTVFAGRHIEVLVTPTPTQPAPSAHRRGGADHPRVDTTTGLSKQTPCSAGFFTYQDQETSA